MARPTAREFIDTLQRVEADGDVDAMVALYADGAAISNPSDERPHTGPEGARRFWDAYVKSFERVRSTFHLIVENDSAAILEWTSECRTAAGVETSYDGVSVIETHDGRITRFAAYFDPADLSIEKK